MREPCAVRSRREAEPLIGTASRARRWLLLEQPGPWAADALHSDRLDPEVAARLRTLAAEIPARVLLIRRTGRARGGTRSRTLLVGFSSATRSWLERSTLREVRDLLDLDLGSLTTGDTLGWARCDRPVYLVCTNGRHDPCCATFGRPVAEALVEVVGERLWECSHVGGDRFAGNLVCLPDGLFYGRLDPDTARTVVDAHEQGRLTLPFWRGRSSTTFAVQAAEAFVREATTADGLAAVRVVSARSDRGTGRTVVRAELHAEHTYEAVVRTSERDTPDGVTCAATGRTCPTYTLESLRRIESSG